MDNVLQDMVQRLRAIELLLRTQNEIDHGRARRTGTDKAMCRGDRGPRPTLFPCTSKPSEKRAGIARPPASQGGRLVTPPISELPH